jgi:hypothetical protein
VSLRRIALLIAALVAGRAAPGLAQQDIIRGKVTGPEGQPLENVTVTATSMADQTTRQEKTNKNGIYMITFNPGSGDYLMTASAIGYQPAVPKQVQNQGGEAFLVWDVKLGKNPVVLNAVVARANRQQVNSNDDNDVSRGSGIGSNDRTMNMGDIALGDMGNLAAMAASLPGVTFIPGTDGGAASFSILGLDASQNMTTVNGLSFDGAELPSDALRGGGVSTNSFNPAQGGFSGGQASFRTSAGTNFVVQRASLNLAPKTLQFTDAAGQQLGVQYNRGQYQFSRAGPIKYDKYYYASSFQFTRQTNNLQTLLNTDELALQRAGVSADSVLRLQGILTAEGIPILVSGLPNDRLTESGSGVLSFDLNPTGSQNYTLSLIGSFSRGKASSLSTTAVPTHGGENQSFNGSIQGRTSWSFKQMFNNALSTSVSLNRSNAVLPDASVRVSSIFDDGTSAITRLFFGGNANLPTTSTTFNWQGTNTISWFSMNNKHQFQLGTDMSFNRYSQDNSRNQFGTFTYNSLADFEAGKPERFTRTLQPVVREGSSISTAFYTSDAWRPTQRFQLQYGVRADVARFNRTPRFNPEVEQLFGIRNDHVPTGVFFSPSVGFNWNFGTGTQVAGFQGATRGARYRLNGGIRMLQNVPRANLIDAAAEQTGLPSSVQTLNCVGTAVPGIDWTALINDPTLIPEQCADGSAGTVLSNTSPNVTLFDKGYTPPRSWRASLAWSGPILWNRFNLGVNTTYSLNLNQQGTIDLNFDNTPRFTLTEEGNRPVFADPAGIVASSGSISTRASRKTQEYSTVNSYVSDLRSVSRQAQFSIRPVTAFQNVFSWNATYVLNNVRDFTRGFSGNTAGDPFDTQWARASGDYRHQFRVGLNYTFKNAIQFSVQPSLQSGTPFTPMVDRDINGDGRGGNDRAFLYDPAKTSDAVLAGQMQALLDDASPSVKKCLTKQLGTVAGRNTCEGPWFFNTSVNINLISQALHLPQRSTIRMGLSNPLVGLDAALHGWNNLKGWGAQPQLETTLLSVRGFDQATQRFKYEINQRFGETRANRTTRVNPFMVTLQISYELGAERERQQLNLNLRRGRAAGTQGKWSEQQWRNTYANQIRNPFQQLLQQADTLKLTDDQADSIAMLNRAFSRYSDSVWTPVAKYLAALPNDYDADEAWDRVKAGWNQVIERLVVLGPAAKALMTKDQITRLPAFLALSLDEAAIRALKPGNANARGRLGGR